MTNINCSSNCIYQKDGKCLYNFVHPCDLTSSSECAYFKSNNQDS